MESTLSEPVIGGAVPAPAAPPGGAPAKDTDEPRRGGSWLRYIGAKAGGAAVSLVMVVLLGFFAFRILPGDPVRSLADGRQVTPEQMDILRRQYGLDQPLPAQFWRYLTDLFQGKLGDSYTYNRPVMELILDRIGPTLLLTGTAAALSVVLGLWLGQRAAWRRGSRFDKTQTGLALVFWSVPTFWLGLLMLLVFAGGLHWFPTGGMVTAGVQATGFEYAWDVARHMVLPVLTMVAVVYAQYLMVMRASLLEEMSADYLVTARAKGLREDEVRRKHAVPNALLPTVTLIFLTLGGLVGGAVTVETVFSWPGLGYLTFQALSAPDFPLLQGTFVVFSSIVIIMNFFADIVYRLLDPRLRAS
ncbi:ABC transporter permease [Arthrobacter sp. TB 26]|uniref:ABC transporter permease n=1 Tax=Arthrobacter sp. TB 26 TaxID=494420 RepID=UPI0004626EA4|nr:ABC transporter permease [Arthrobacter sp. TB 26]